MPKPTAIHKFFNNDHQNLTTPSWYVKMDRVKTETILRKNNMSEVIRPSKEGGYALSAISQSGKIAHFEIKVVQGKFQLVLDDPPEPKTCLYDILDYYISSKKESFKNEKPNSGTLPIVRNKESSSLNTELDPEYIKPNPKNPSPRPLPRDTKRPDTKLDTDVDNDYLTPDIGLNNQPLPDTSEYQNANQKNDNSEYVNNRQKIVKDNSKSLRTKDNYAAFNSLRIK